MVVRQTGYDGHVSRVTAGGAVTNFPSNQQLLIKSRGSFAARVYIRFTITDFPSTINDSILTIHQVCPSINPGTVQIYSLDVDPASPGTIAAIWDSFASPGSTLLTTWTPTTTCPIVNLALALGDTADANIAAAVAAARPWYAIGLMFVGDMAGAADRSVRINAMEAGSAATPVATLTVL